MLNSVVLSLLLVVANVMGAGMIVPQVVRLRRLRVADGVSAVGVGVGVALNVWWTVYSLEAGLWGIVPVSVAGFGLYSIVAAQLVGLTRGRAGASLALGAFGLGMLPLPFFLLGGWPLAGLAIGLSYGLQFAPAARAALGSEHLDGISPTTWSMAWIEALIWLIYGIAVRDATLLIGGGGGTVMATIILARLLVAVRPTFRIAPVSALSSS